MLLRRFPSYEDWLARNLGEMFEIHAAARYPEADMHMRQVDQWVKWASTTDAIQPMVREYYRLMQRVRG